MKEGEGEFLIKAPAYLFLSLITSLQSTEYGGCFKKNFKKKIKKERKKEGKKERKTEKKRRILSLQLFYPWIYIGRQVFFFLFLAFWSFNSYLIPP
jgi:hypothetical protein